MAVPQDAPAVSNSPLFSQVCFHIIESNKLGGQAAADLTSLLVGAGGAEHAPPSKDGKVPLHGLTHIITETIDFEPYEEATSKLISVVTKGWVEASILKERLANPKSHSPDPRLFYSGLVVCTADLPEGDKDAIIGGVLAMGGLYSGSISRLVTHIVALNMEPEACQLAVVKGLRCKIVLPHWFDDCLRLGKRIDEGPYLLPNPEIMRKRPSDHINAKTRPDLQGALSPEPGPLPTPAGSPSREREGLKVFANKKVMLSSDLGIAYHLQKTIELLITNGGGEVIESVADADILVCQYRDGDDYYTASVDGKTVGNLPWLYSLITRNSWTSPLKRLLHYPIARYGLPGVKAYRISLSNYNGEARVYLENLAKAAGCEFTKTMKQDNTHLITAHTVSEKCDAAKEWGIHMINHLWLEESYAKWRIQSVSEQRYTHFPPRTNLTEVVGQTTLDKDALERHFFPKGAKGRRNYVTKPEAKTSPDSLRGHTDDRSLDSSAPRVTKLSHDRQLTQRSKHSEPPTPESKGRNEDSAMKTPAHRRVSADDKENDTPPSRGAKDRAIARLNQLVPDIALYEKEKKRIGGVLFGGRRAKEYSPTFSRKRSVSTEDNSGADAENAEAERHLKRVKKTKPPPEMRVLVTGFPRWAGDSKTQVKEKNRLRALGILLTQEPKNCSYLAAPKILRTQKFCCAIAHGPVIISTTFLEECLAQDKLLQPEDYPLNDPDGEKHYGLDLDEVIARAKANKGRLLSGQTIWVTEGIHGGFDTYRSIIEMNGGKCQLFRGRSGSIPALVEDERSDNDDEDDSEPVFAHLVSGTTAEEAKLWPKFRSMAQTNGTRPRVVRTDWMLDLALSQQIVWDEGYELAHAGWAAQK